MEIDSVIVRLFRASAITICPIILVDPDLHGAARKRTLVHEWVHWRQQLLFGAVGALGGAVVWLALSWPPQPEMALTVGLGAIEGWVAGQLLWRWLYLVGVPLGLPIGWNPWRMHWETEAFRAQGLDDTEIRQILRGPPYYLWWVRHDST